MNNFFATPEGAWGDGTIHLTPAGLITSFGLVVLLILISLLVRHKKTASTTSARTITTKQLIFSAMAMALATVTSMIKFLSLPMDGSITLFSMLFVALVGYWYGPSIGIMTAVAYGILQFILKPTFLAIPQLFLDYPLAFGSLGLSGFFYKKKNGLAIGYLVGVIGRFIFATISGVVYFGSYAPEGTPALIYSITYQASYIVPEAAVTLFLITRKPVANALAHVKKLARAEI